MKLFNRVKKISETSLDSGIQSKTPSDDETSQATTEECPCSARESTATKNESTDDQSRPSFLNQLRRTIFYSNTIRLGRTRNAYKNPLTNHTISWEERPMDSKVFYHFDKFET